MTCTCPEPGATSEEVEAHPGYDPEGWRHHRLGGQARTEPGEIHYPGCPLYRTREETNRIRVEEFMKANGLL